MNSSDLETLQSMFPQASSEDLEMAMTSNITIDYAIEEMLSRYSDNTDTASMYSTILLHVVYIACTMLIISIT